MATIEPLQVNPINMSCKGDIEWEGLQTGPRIPIGMIQGSQRHE